jgi:hypothetical protein
MRLASYKVSDEEGNKLDFSVTTFPGDVGGLLANVNRWLGQIGLEPTDEEGLKQYVSPITIDGMTAQLVEASSTDKTFYAAILMRNNSSWFFKLTGGKTLALKEKENFSEFLERPKHFSQTKSAFSVARSPCHLETDSYSAQSFHGAHLHRHLGASGNWNTRSSSKIL